mgnify:CR=1 FL=1
MTFHIRMPVRFVAALALLLFCFQAYAAEFDNGLLLLSFDDNTGQLTAFKDLRNGHDFTGAPAAEGLWKIDLLPGAAKQAIVPSDAKSFACHANADEKVLNLVWSGFSGDVGERLTVTANVALDKDAPMSRWRIVIEGLDKAEPAAVRFPRIAGITPQENETLVMPVWMGERTSRARELLDGKGRFEWEYPGLLSMQCLALYRENGPGFYAACDDIGTRAKRFAVFGLPDRGLGIELTQLPENGTDGAARYESPYSVILGAFEGDWFTAAEQYRSWALQQSWAKQSRMDTGAVNGWLGRTGIWIWNRGRSDGVLGPALALQERSQMPVSVFWHWWHGCPYDVGFPEYLPPREGNDAFRKALGEAQAKGVHALVYMNQRLWGMTTKSWTDENAERFAVKDPAGKVHPEVYNTFTKSPCASMCMGTDFWRNKYAGLAEQAVNGLGVDGIYMDQACSSLACYDPTHGHPLGGGSYWMGGFQRLQADIRERTSASRQVVLAGEGCGEAWLPYLDLMLSLQVSMERYAQPGAWEPIPFFHAVYHGHGTFYGNYSSLTMPPYDDLWPAETAPKEPMKLLDRTFSVQFRLEQARAFVWGQQPTIANFRPSQFDDRPEEIAFALRLARLRMQALPYLQQGTMLRPPVTGLSDEPLDISRLSIYAGQQEPLKQYEKNCPPVLASAWREPDGTAAIVLVNVTDTPRNLALKLDDTGVGATSRLSVVKEDGSRSDCRFQAETGVLAADLAAEDACICILAKD